ncbi:NAD(P)H-quinone oxidoreductase [Agrobacterium tumefaciens]|nr:NAD(P)H-quinone oxidoreductase [Agrobacterium tumefaciens]
MKAVLFDAVGGPEVLKHADRPVPLPGPGEVQIEIVATAMNFADLLQRQGNYSNHANLNPILGLECAGRISALGAGVETWQVGDDVCALLNGGGYAEYAVVSAGHVLPVPKGVALRDAAVLPEAACTVWSNIVDLAGLTAGETFLVHGGGGGVGSLAIQVAVGLGAEVFCTAGSPEKLDFTAALGVRRGIHYRDEDFVAATLDATGGKGVDVILDVMGAAYLPGNIEALAFDGRISMIGLQSGREAQISLGVMMKKRASLFTTSLRDRPAAAKQRIVAGVKADIWPLVDTGAVQPVIDRRFGLDDIVDAHRYMESGRHIGKLVIDVRPA